MESWVKAALTMIVGVIAAWVAHLKKSSEAKLFIFAFAAGVWYAIWQT